jgi:Aspartyl protease
MIDMHPMVKAQINGVDASFIADSGAFYSMLSHAAASEFKLNSYLAPFGLFVRGMGGSASVSVAKVKVFTLAGVPIHNVEFLVGGGDFGGAGLLGQNVFSIGDVEYDLANGSAAILLSGGVVRLRLGDYDKSIDDFDAALVLRPKSAWSLYGRGIAKIRRSKTAEGQADMAAAEVVWPPIADAFAMRGITP